MRRASWTSIRRFPPYLSRSLYGPRPPQHPPILRDSSPARPRTNHAPPQLGNRNINLEHGLTCAQRRRGGPSRRRWPGLHGGIRGCRTQRRGARDPRRPARWQAEAPGTTFLSPIPPSLSASGYPITTNFVSTQIVSHYPVLQKKYQVPHLHCITSAGLSSSKAKPTELQTSTPRSHKTSPLRPTNTTSKIFPRADPRIRRATPSPSRTRRPTLRSPTPTVPPRASASTPLSSSARPSRSALTSTSRRSRASSRGC